MVRPLDAPTPRPLPRNLGLDGGAATATTTTTTTATTTTTPTAEAPATPPAPTARRGHGSDGAEATVSDGRADGSSRVRSLSDAGAALREHRLHGDGDDVVRADYGKEGAARFVSTRPVRGAEAERVRLAETTPVNLRRGTAAEQTEARRALLASSPQVNAVSVRAGNSQSICGAAALTNALIMSDDHGKNAAALSASARRAGVQPTEAQQLALDRFRDGRLSPQDVAHLQQLTYRVAVTADTGSQPRQRLTVDGLDLGIRESQHTPSRAERAALDQFRRDPTQLSDNQNLTLRNLAVTVGVIDRVDADLDPAPPHLITAGGMGATAGLLRGEGAFTDTELHFHNSRLRDPRGHDFNHWTVDVGGASFNSLPTRAGGPAQVTDVPGREIATSSSDRNFEGSVVVGPRRLVIDTPNDRQRMTHIEFAPRDDAPATWQGVYGGLARITNRRDPENAAFSVDDARAR